MPGVGRHHGRRRVVARHDEHIGVEVCDPFDGGIDEAGNSLAPLTTFVIRSAGKLVLVDTGIGPTLGSLAQFGFEGGVGLLPGALEAAGIDPNRVDAVVFTHLHSDHIGWSVVGETGHERPMFPNARYVVTRPEWEYWSGTRSRDIARCIRPVEASRQLDIVDDGYEAAPGVSLMASPGHTPGHTCVLIPAAGGGGLITGDAAHHPIEMEQPELKAVFDSDPDLSCASRLRMVERVEAEGLTVMGGHFPPPSAGNLVRVGTKRAWRWLGA